MKKKTICIILALLMSLMITLPASADGFADMQPQRTGITASFGLKHISGSKYRMWARINNLEESSVFVRLTIYNSSNIAISSICKTSSNLLISLNKDITLYSGTYHLKLSYTVDGVTYTAERTYIV